MTINPYDSPLSPTGPPTKKPVGWLPRLIEVLVVIFITVMLLALLLPVMRFAGAVIDTAN